MRVGELRQQGMELLQAAHLEAPQHECDYLLSGLLNVPLLELRLDPSRCVSEAESAQLLEAFRRRAEREPAQYIIGTAPFRDLELAVSPAVLIPRPETEELVSLALERAPRNAKVLDMGTGSGAIPVALKSERPDLQLTAVDLSEKALQIARLNAERCRTEIEFLPSDLWSALEGRVFDLVTANLPYVSESEYAQCDPEIFFEPVMALTAPHEGLELMEKMISELHPHLAPGGWAIFELSPQQNHYIRSFGESRGFSGTTVRDLEGKERFVLLHRER